MAISSLKVSQKVDLEVFTYDHLSTETESGPWIRLLTLPPGDKSGRVNCTLTPHLLSQAPNYEAVSYCWGDEKDTAQILCDGKLLTVPSNLHAFLLRTRAMGKSRTLWIDSICINQSNSTEKDSQVRAMRHIYKGAKKTLIWLGKEYENSTLGLEFASELYKKFIGKNLTPTVRKWYQFRASNTTRAVLSPEWKAFFHIFDRQWFTRAWIIQEVAVSSQAFVICGDKSIQWTELSGALQYVSQEENYVFEFHGAQNINMVFVMNLSLAEVSQSMEKGVYEILSRHRSALSTNPRDSVFAYYGLSCRANMIEHKIQPDYEITTRKLFIDLAVSTIQKSSDLNFLGVPRTGSVDSELYLPSWVVDWSSAKGFCSSLALLEYYGSLPEDHRNLYAAAKNTIHTPNIDEKNLRLGLSGYVFDQLESVSTAWILQDVSGVQTLRKQALTLERNQQFIFDWESVIYGGSQTKYMTGEDMTDVLREICTAGRPSFDGKNSVEVFRGFAKRQWYLRIIRTLHIHNFIWSWMFVVILGHVFRFFGIPNPEIPFRGLTHFLIHRRCGRTSKGLIALIPGEAQVGDSIALCEGGKLPLVLRPNGNNWELVGDCYVHGIMKGEAWGEKCQDMWLV